MHMCTHTLYTFNISDIGYATELLLLSMAHAHASPLQNGDDVLGAKPRHCRGASFLRNTVSPKLWMVQRIFLNEKSWMLVTFSRKVSQEN